MPTHPLLRRPFLALVIVSFAISFLASPLFALLPVYVESNLERSPLFSAGLRTLFLILGGIFAVPAGRLGDRLGIKWIYVLSILGPVFAGFVFRSSDPLVLASLCIGIGITQGFGSAGGQSYLISAVPSSAIGMASAGYFLGNTLGTSLGNAAAAPFLRDIGFGAVGLMASAGALVLLLGAAFLLPALTPDKPTAARSLGLSGSGQLLRRREVRLLLGIRFLPTCYWGGVTLLVPLLIYRHTGDPGSAATYSAVSLAIAAGFQLLTGRLCDRIGRWKPILVAASGVTLSAVGLTVFGDTVAGLYGFGTMAAATAWSLSTTMPGLLQLIAKEGERGKIVGIAHLVWSAGMLTGNLGAGALIEEGTVFPFGVGALCCAGALACGVGLYRHYANCESPSDSA